MKSKVAKANYEQREYNNLDFLYANVTDDSTLINDKKGDN